MRTASVADWAWRSELKQTQGLRWGWAFKSPIRLAGVRVLVTNDDGVNAPGLAALTRALVRWVDAVAMAGGPQHEIVVVAPSSNYSGGSVTERTTIAYSRAKVEGAESVEAFGLDASPALSVIAGALGAVGPKPDLVLSGINHGVNVGRSVLHSGTVGAALTAAQLGISALAVSLRAGVTPDPWDSAAELATSLIPVLAAAPTSTVLNLNVPALPLSDILGLRSAKVSGAGLIKAASEAGEWDGPNSPEMEGPAALEGSRSVMEGGGDASGEIVLTVGSPFPAGGDAGMNESTEDAGLVAQGYAALTALRGPRADDDPELLGLLNSGLAAALAPLGLAAR
jgi:5'-nucleotidase